jgi:CIC family chloride channel protein
LVGRGVSSLLQRARAGEHTFVVVVAILIGVLSAYGAIAFRYLIALSHLSFFATTEYSVPLLQGLPLWHRVLVPTAGGLLVGLIVTRLAPEVRGSGIPEVIESVARRGGAIRLRVVVTKAIAAALTIGSGGSAGREGPIVHIGSAIGSSVGQALEVVPRRLRTFVACGAAGGIAATFNAPIAGALFSVEVVLTDLGVSSLSPIVISSVVATMISRHHLGDFPAFRVPAYELLSARELLIYGCLGLLAGLVAVAFIRCLYASARGFERLTAPDWLKPGIGGLGVGLISLALPYVYGVGYETINAALWGRTALWLLLLLIPAKILATSCTLGSGGSGGVFAPSLFMGAVLGAAVGQVAGGVFPSWVASTGAYALVGMGAVVAGTTHAPITAILIIFELTNDYHSIPPLMLACVLAVLVSSKLHPESIYTAKLAQRGIRLEDGRDVNLLNAIKVSEVMETEVPTVTAGTPFRELVRVLVSTPHPELFVVDGQGRLLGSVELSQIKVALPDQEALATLVVAADVMDSDVPYLLPDDRLDLAMHLFGRDQRDEIPVCTGSEDREVIGYINHQAVIEAYNRRVFQMDLVGGVGSILQGIRAGRTVELLGGFHVAEVEVPSVMVGKTLREVDLRRHHNLEVVLIHHADPADGAIEGRPGQFPAPDVALEAGDRLLVMGTLDAIQRLQ